MASDICQDAALCELSAGGAACIAASLMWLIVAGTVLQLKAYPRRDVVGVISAAPPRYPEESPRASEQETIEEEVLPAARIT